MASDDNGQKDDKLDAVEVKMEPSLPQRYVDQDDHQDNGHFENTVAKMSSSVDAGSWNLWTSKATNCLIGQYKKYRSMVGQSSQIRSLREMFEMISLEMQNHGFHFSPQKCENKWRVLERKYKNLVFRERLKKPGRMRHYGQWEHKRALDEIFGEKKRHVCPQANDPQMPGESAESPLIAPRANSDQIASDAATSGDRQDGREDPPSFGSTWIGKADEQTDFDHERILMTLCEKFIEETGKHFASAESNKERRHREKMAVKQKELELTRQLLKLKEQKVELQRCQVMAAARNLQRPDG